MAQIDIDYEHDFGLWSLDDMAKSETNNLLIVLCERKVDNKLVKYLKLQKLSQINVKTQNVKYRASDMQHQYQHTSSSGYEISKKNSGVVCISGK